MVMTMDPSRSLHDVRQTGISTISVALCTYNGARYLQQQLESIAGQTRRPDEVVVCDDGSGDSTMEFVRSFAKTATFHVRVYQNDRVLGVTKNFDQAIGYCTGDMIALSDQDDVWHPQKLVRMEQAFAASPRVGAVFWDAEVVDSELRPLGHRL